MKITGMLLSTVAMTVAASAFAQSKAPACYEKGTQAELDQCAAGDYAQADQELNRVWKDIQTRYADQPLFLKKLKAAQLLWLQFRDAEVEAKYPLEKGDDARGQYGSSYPMCVGQFKAELTRARTRDLRAWLVGGAEGDVCMGSLKLSDDLIQAKP